MFRKFEEIRYAFRNLVIEMHCCKLLSALWLERMGCDVFHYGCVCIVVRNIGAEVRNNGYRICKAIESSNLAWQEYCPSPQAICHNLDWCYDYRIGEGNQTTQTQN